MVCSLSTLQTFFTCDKSPHKIRRSVSCLSSNHLNLAPFTPWILVSYNCFRSRCAVLDYVCYRSIIIWLLLDSTNLCEEFSPIKTIGWSDTVSSLSPFGHEYGLIHSLSFKQAVKQLVSVIMATFFILQKTKTISVLRRGIKGEKRCTHTQNISRVLTFCELTFLLLGLHGLLIQESEIKHFFGILFFLFSIRMFGVLVVKLLRGMELCYWLSATESAV